MPEWVETELPMPKLPNDILQAALEGFEEQKRALDRKIADLRAMLIGSTPEAPSNPSSLPTRRKMSAAGRRAIAAAQRKRWAAVRAQAPLAPSQPKKKRKLSAAGRAAIIAAAKKRWAAQRAAA